MRRVMRARWAVIAVCVAPWCLSAQSFEGVITVRLTSGSASGPSAQDVEYLSRGGNVRVNIASPAGPLSILGLAAEAKAYLVLESQRSYMEIPAAEAVASVASSAGATTITRSGRKELIAGYECEHVIVASNVDATSRKTDMCLTSALGPYVNPMASLSGGRLAPWQRTLATDGGFPLKVTLPDGTVALEVTKIVKRRVSDTMFRIPADYSKADMPRRPPTR